MIFPDNRLLEVWDSDYRTRGLLWGGNPAPLPALPEGSGVLELGCGNGKNLPGMIEKGWDITAMDCSITALQLCRPVVRDPGRVHFVVGNAISLPLRDAVVDAVFSLHVAGHLTGPGRSQLAREVFRVLKPGGQIVFRDFGVDDFRCGKGQMTEPGTFHRGTGSFTHYFTGDEVSRLFIAFKCKFIDEHRWVMRIKGQDYQRCEITAIFEKSA
jgi:SAM-dependent methyltransferase